MTVQEVLVMLKVSFVVVIVLWLLGMFSWGGFPWYLHAAAFLTAAALLIKQSRLSKRIVAERVPESTLRNDHRYTI